MRVPIVLIALAGAAGVSLPAMAAPRAAFDVKAESDASLAQISGRATNPHLVSNARLIMDGTTRVMLRQSAETSEVSMANWWAETGAMYIAANIIASRMPQ